MESKSGTKWYQEDQVVKVDPKALGLATRPEHLQKPWMRGAAHRFRVGGPALHTRALCELQPTAAESTAGRPFESRNRLRDDVQAGGWLGKGRAEASSRGAEVDLNFDVVQMGFMSSYVDAQVHYAEAGLEIRGTWRAADGTEGSVTGTKALAGIAMGGLWHVELQTGAESMQHAWNCWRRGRCIRYSYR